MTPQTDAAAPQRPRAAAEGRRVLSQAAFEARGVIRNGEQLLVSLVLPLLVLLALVSTDLVELTTGTWAAASQVDVAVPGVLALAIVSTAFTGQAILLGYERRYGVLRLLGSSPLGSDGLVAGKAIAVLGVVLLQSLVLSAVGFALGWRPDLAGLAGALLAGATGTIACVAGAALVGGTMRAEAVLAVANLLWVLAMAFGALLVPIAQDPSWWQSLVGLSPTGALAEALREALVGGGFPALPILVLVAWAAVLSFLAARFLRWSD